MNNSAFIPILRVKDARKSAQFYQSHFGFGIDWEHQFETDYPLFISISSDSLHLFLSEHMGTGTDEADLYVYLEDVDALHTRLQAGKVVIQQQPTDQPWGVRDMQIRDLDGHRITFATRKA